MYDHQNPYNSQYPDCIIGPYNYYHPDDPLPHVYNGIDSFGVIILGVHVDSPARHSPPPSDKAIEGYLNKQGEMSSFSCTHNVFILHYKTANNTYSPKNPYNWIPQMHHRPLQPDESRRSNPLFQRETQRSRRLSHTIFH